MKYKYCDILSAVIMLLVMVSCNDHELVRLSEVRQSSDGRCLINLTSSEAALSAATRADSDNLPSGEKVYVWGDEVSGSANYIKAWEVTANGSGGFSSSTTQYFPPSGKSLQLFGMHGNFADTPSGNLGSYTHTVVADQTSASQASDLSYAVSAATAPGGTSKTINLPFHHMLAKVRLAMATNDDDSDLSGCTVRIVDGAGDLTFTPARTTAADMDTDNVRWNMLGTHSSKADLQLPLVEVADFDDTPTDYAEAIMVPQTYTGTAMLTLTLPTGEEMTFKPDNLTLKGGYQHTLHIEVELSSRIMMLRGSITPWNEGSIDADPTPEVIEGETAAINPWKTGSTEADED